MDDKIFGMFLNMSRATDKCLSGVEATMDALVRQVKVNRRQRAVNCILFGMVLTCVCNISDLLKTTRQQNEKIKKLEGATEKGE